MSDAAAPSGRCRCSTATLSGAAGEIVVLRVAGEVDLGSFPVLDAALDDVLDRRPDHLVVDLTGLVFCSVRGLTAITQSVQAAAARGIRYSMSGASPSFSRLWPQYWPEGDAPRIHRTTADAVLAALVLEAERWQPVPVVDVEREHLGAGEHDLDGRAAPVGKDDDDASPRQADGHHSRPAADPAASEQALHRQRSTTYRAALHALGVSYGAHPAAPDLAVQLRIALTDPTATPAGDQDDGSRGVRSTPPPAGRGAPAGKTADESRWRRGESNP